MLVAGPIVGLLVVAAALAPFLSPADPNALNPRAKAQPPTFAHLLGTDEFGRDLLSRLLHGARITLIVGLSSVSVAATAGTLLGSAAAYARGPVETGIMRVMDGLLCFPPILLGIFVVTFLGPSLRNLILVIAVLYVPRFTRVVHASTLAIRELEYVESARALGASAVRVVAGAILPNIVAPILVQASLAAGHAILLESGLSFLGLGPPRPRRRGGGWWSSRGASCSSPSCRFSGRPRPSRSRSWHSISWETGCATSSIPGSAAARERRRHPRDPAPRAPRASRRRLRARPCVRERPRGRAVPRLGSELGRGDDAVPGPRARRPHDDSSTAYHLAIALRTDDRAVGSCRIEIRDDAGQTGDLGYVFDKAQWGRGYATEAGCALLVFGFERLGFHRIWARCDVRNAASARVLEKLGMEREGRLRHDVRRKGEWHDSFLYAILEPDWRKLRRTP